MDMRRLAFPGAHSGGSLVQCLSFLVLSDNRYTSFLTPLVTIIDSVGSDKLVCFDVADTL